MVVICLVKMNKLGSRLVSNCLVCCLFASTYMQTLLFALHASCAGSLLLSILQHPIVSASDLLNMQNQARFTSCQYTDRKGKQKRYNIGIQTWARVTEPSDTQSAQRDLNPYKDSAARKNLGLPKYIGAFTPGAPQNPAPQNPPLNHPRLSVRVPELCKESKRFVSLP